MIIDQPAEDSQEELKRLRVVETMRDYLESENIRLRSELNQEREKNAHLHDSIEGLIGDMSLMEAHIAELRGEEPF